MGRKLFVGNLPFSTDERRLQELFAAVGPVDTVNIVRDQMTGRARGFAFVEMQTDEAAQSAIQKLNDEGCTCGCNLTVARCRVDDPSCPVSLPRAKEIVAGIASGN
jgi:RNA recognition motif-containing protein